MLLKLQKQGKLEGQAGQKSGLWYCWYLKPPAILSCRGEAGCSVVPCCSDLLRDWNFTSSCLKIYFSDLHSKIISYYELKCYESMSLRFFFFLKSYARILFFSEKKKNKNCKTKIKCCCMKLSYICSTTRLLQAASHKMPPVLCTIWENLAPKVLFSPTGGEDSQTAVLLWSTLPKLPTTTTFPVPIHRGNICSWGTVQMNTDRQENRKRTSKALLANPVTVVLAQKWYNLSKM